VIAATNRNLEEEVAAGRFRLDLYYRLNVYPIILPPLRDRKNDIELLAKSFIARFSKEIESKVTGLSDAVIADMLAYDWPGNVRELENLMERCVLQAKGQIIEISPLQKERAAPAATDAPGRMKTIEENERDYIISVLKACKGKVYGRGGAAEILNISVSSLNARIKKLGIEKHDI